MLFNSGTPSLVSQAHEYAGDPTGGPQSLFGASSSQLVKNAINFAYMEMRVMGQLKDVGVAVKRTYATTVAGQIFYQIPADADKLKMVEIETGGQDLTTVAITSASIVVLEPKEEDVAMKLYNAGDVTSTIYLFIHDQHFGIVSPPIAGSVGSNAMRLTYEAASAALSGDTDEPDIPRNHHELIAVKAAIRLLITREMDPSGLAPLHNLLSANYQKSIADQMDRYNAQIPVAGVGLRGRMGTSILQGTIKRT